MRRVVQPELLDDLPPADPRAIGSRGDLRRLNRIMGHEGILAREFSHHANGSRQIRLVDLGAGDGTLMLRLAQRWTATGITGHITLLDRQNLISTETRRGFEDLKWSVENVAADVFAWLQEATVKIDVMVANLFLHHFPEERLQELLRLAAARTKLFIACEPRRGPVSLVTAQLLWVIGCNGITRHDAVVSVQAGFTGKELTMLWPDDGKWELHEKTAGLFSHCFVAKKHE